MSAAGAKSKRITVATTPTPLSASGGNYTYPVSIVVLNDSAVTIYVGGSDVDTTDGFPVAVGGTFSTDLVGDALYACVAASTANVHVFRRNGT